MTDTGWPASYTKPSQRERELIAIIENLKMTPDWGAHMNYSIAAVTYARHFGTRPTEAPRFTSSIDSARELVPPDFWWKLKGSHGVGYRAEVGAIAGIIKTGIEISYAESPNPAVALCIAALSAIAEIKKHARQIAAIEEMSKEQARWKAVERYYPPSP